MHSQSSQKLELTKPTDSYWLTLKKEHVMMPGDGGAAIDGRNPPQKSTLKALQLLQQKRNAATTRSQRKTPPGSSDFTQAREG